MYGVFSLSFHLCTQLLFNRNHHKQSFYLKPSHVLAYTCYCCPSGSLCGFFLSAKLGLAAWSFGSTRAGGRAACQPALAEGAVFLLASLKPCQGSPGIRSERHSRQGAAILFDQALNFASLLLIVRIAAAEDVFASAAALIHAGFLALEVFKITFSFGDFIFNSLSRVVLGRLCLDQLLHRFLQPFEFALEVLDFFLMHFSVAIFAGTFHITSQVLFDLKQFLVLFLNLLV